MRPGLDPVCVWGYWDCLLGSAHPQARGLTPTAMMRPRVWLPARPSDRLPFFVAWRPGRCDASRPYDRQSAAIAPPSMSPKTRVGCNEIVASVSHRAAFPCATSPQHQQTTVLTRDAG